VRRRPRGAELCHWPHPCASPAIVPGRVTAHRAVLGVVPARPEKLAIGPCLGRQFGPTPNTARHEKGFGLHSAGLHRAGLHRARAGWPVWNTITAITRGNKK
jgi:hypothetical protein